MGPLINHSSKSKKNNYKNLTLSTLFYYVKLQLPANVSFSHMKKLESETFPSNLELFMMRDQQECFTTYTFNIYCTETVMFQLLLPLVAQK